MEAYIDDMVVKSKQTSEHLNDLGNVFREHKLSFNASKCYFRLYEVNPNQIKAINNLHPPQNPKEVQKLTKMTVALNRFISWLAECCRPFFQLLHKWKNFEWTKECIDAFEELNWYLSYPHVLSRPKKEEVLYAYIAVNNHTLSLVLVRTNDRVQKPVYYVSKSLQEA